MEKTRVAKSHDQQDSAPLPLDVVVPLEKPFADERGVIQPLVSQQVNDVALITSRKGRVRANHCHKTDWHYCYVLSGAIEYFHRPAGSTTPPEKVVVKAGDMFFTPPMVEHAMNFLEDTVFIAMSHNSREHKKYEADVVRVKLI